MQEAFIKLYENCKKVIFDKAKSFIFTVANRLFLNEHKHQKVVLSFQKKIISQETSETPQFQLEEKEFKSELEQAISDLSEKQREAFLMNRIDKMSYNEIAERLETSVKAVEKRIHTVLLKLKDSVSALKKHKI